MKGNWIFWGTSHLESKLLLVSSNGLSIRTFPWCSWFLLDLSFLAVWHPDPIPWPILTYWNTFTSCLLDEFLTLTSVRESVDAGTPPILHIRSRRPELEAFCCSRSRLPTLCILGVSFRAHHLTSLGQIFSSLKWIANTVLYRVVQGIWCSHPPKNTH